MRIEQQRQQRNPMSDRRIQLICGLVEPSKEVLCIGCRNDDVITINLKKITTKLKTLDCVKNTADIIVDLDRCGIPLSSKRFEYVVAGEIIEHLYDTDYIFIEINRVLVRGGVLVLSVPNICGLRSRMKMIFGKLPVACSKDEHIRDFNLSLILRYLKRNNFKVNEIKTDGVWIRNKNILPSRLCRKTWGEHIIVKAESE